MFMKHRLWTRHVTRCHAGAKTEETALTPSADESTAGEKSAGTMLVPAENNTDQD